jgi:hypothetical protein
MMSHSNNSLPGSITGMLLEAAHPAGACWAEDRDALALSANGQADAASEIGGYAPADLSVLHGMADEPTPEEDGRVPPRTRAAARVRLRQALEAALERLDDQRLLALLDQTTGELAGYLGEYLELLANLQRCEVLLGQAERLLDGIERLVAAESAPVEDRGRRAADVGDGAVAQRTREAPA